MSESSVAGNEAKASKSSEPSAAQQLREVRQTLALLDRFAPSRSVVDSFFGPPPPRQPEREPLVLTRASEVQEIRQRWLWPPYLPVGHVSLLVGEPGVGKSLLTCELAAWATRGRWPVWPGGAGEGEQPLGACDVLMINGEDLSWTNVKPRLARAGAELERVVMVEKSFTPGGFYLDREAQQLYDAVKGYEDLRLIVIDPLPAFLSGPEPSNHAAARRMLQPLQTLALVKGAAVVVVLHLNKKSGGPTLNRVAGSLAYTAAARSVLEIIEDPGAPGRRLLVSRKNNHAAPPPVLAFGIEDQRLVWEREPLGAREAAAVCDRHSYALHTWNLPVFQAMDWLRARLAAEYNVQSSEVQSWDPEVADSNIPRPEQAAEQDGCHLPGAGVLVEEVYREARARGITEATLRRAKQRLGVESLRPTPTGGWVWRLREEGGGGPGASGGERGAEVGGQRSEVSGDGGQERRVGGDEGASGVVTCMDDSIVSQAAGGERWSERPPRFGRGRKRKHRRRRR